MSIKTKPLLLAIAISFALASHAIAAYTPTVAAGTTVDDEIIDGSNGFQEVNGTENRATVLSGSTLGNVGGIDNDTVVKSGGFIELGTNAISNNAIIENGGKATITDGGQANGWVINGPVGAIDTVVMWSNTKINNSTLNGGNLVINYGTATNTIVNSGRMTNFGADINTIINGGTYLLTGKFGKIATSSNLTVNTGAKAEIGAATVTDAIVNGTMMVHSEVDTTLQGISSVNNNGELTIEGSLVDGDPTSPTLQGNVSVANGGKITIDDYVNSKNAIVMLSGSGSLYLSRMYVSQQTPDYTLGAMTLNGGNIYFVPQTNRAQQAVFSSLTLSSLDGNGSFYMNTDLAGLQGNFLNVTGQANGGFDVHIADSGVSPTSNSSLQIIQTGGGNAAFTLANNGHVVDAGTYQYYLVADGKGGWALTPKAAPIVQVIPATKLTPATQVIPASELTPATQVIPATELTRVIPVMPTITPGTAAVLSMATVDPLIFQAELSSVRSRLEQVRSFSHDTNVWGHYTSSHYNVGDSAGADYGMYVNGVTIGADKSLESDNGVTTQGVFFSTSHSDVDFDRGGKGKVDSYSAGAYSSYRHDSGFYLDGVLKVNRFGNDVNGRMTSGAAANGDYNTTGIGTNLEGGKYFAFGDSFIAPYAAVTGFTSNSSEYALSNGMKAQVSPQRSVMGEAGMSLGHKFVVRGAQVQPYIKLAVTQEFIDDNAVKVNDDHFINDLSGTRGVYQFGVNTKVTDRLTARADASYAQGSHVEAPWTANLGASWSF